MDPDGTTTTPATTTYKCMVRGSICGTPDTPGVNGDEPAGWVRLGNRSKHQQAWMCDQHGISLGSVTDEDTGDLISYEIIIE